MGKKDVKKKTRDIKARAFDEMVDAFARYDNGWYGERKEKEEKK